MSSNSVEMPDPVSEMLTPTLNLMGFMTAWIDPYTEAFVKFAPLAPKTCLDIGAAYGIASLAALATGAEVIACDPDWRHLEICLQKTPSKQKSRLRLLQGSLPDQINLEDGSLGAILCSRVLHFLTGPEIEESVRNMSRWLCSGGRVYLIADTPYNRFLKSFLPIYEERKRRGDLWPGQIDNFPQFMPTELAPNLPNFFHTLDPDILARVCTKMGLIVERKGFISRIDYLPDAQDDGREGVGIIAYKP
ncbi:MAG: class I SAM-dependent methyltransferase [Microcystis aeruginosa G13-11]|nr:class I SAM-dependent methyltransferase [Microcystis aeruginosa G13-11]